MDKHADPLDKASDIAQMFADQGLDAVRQKVRPEQTQLEDGTWPHVDCIACGDEIPEQRLAMGKVRCTPCQDLKERRERGFK